MRKIKELAKEYSGSRSKSFWNGHGHPVAREPRDSSLPLSLPSVAELDEQVVVGETHACDPGLTRKDYAHQCLPEDNEYQDEEQSGEEDDADVDDSEDGDNEDGDNESQCNPPCFEMSRQSYLSASVQAMSDTRERTGRILQIFIVDAPEPGGVDISLLLMSGEECGKFVLTPWHDLSNVVAYLQAHQAWQQGIFLSSDGTLIPNSSHILCGGACTVVEVVDKVWCHSCHTRIDGTPMFQAGNIYHFGCLKHECEATYRDPFSAQTSSIMRHFLICSLMKN